MIRDRGYIGLFTNYFHVDCLWCQTQWFVLHKLASTSRVVGTLPVFARVNGNDPITDHTDVCYVTLLHIEVVDSYHVLLVELSDVCFKSM